MEEEVGMEEVGSFGMCPEGTGTRLIGLAGGVWMFSGRMKCPPRTRRKCEEVGLNGEEGYLTERTPRRDEDHYLDGYLTDSP